MMFISSSSKGFLIAGTAQCLVLGHKDSLIKNTFGKQMNTMQNRLHEYRRQKLSGLPGANEIKALESQIQQSKFDTPEPLDLAVRTFPGTAMQTHLTGQALSSHPAWTRRGPCGKCAIIYQFSSPSPAIPVAGYPPTPIEPPNLKLYKAFSCAEDAWEIKRRYIESSPQNQMQETYGTE